MNENNIRYFGQDYVAAERIVLGAMLSGRGYFMEEALQKPYLKNYFFSRPHGWIFDGTLSLNSKGLFHASLNTIVEELHKMGHLESSGGVEYIESLYDTICTPEKFEYNIQLLEERYFSWAIRKTIAKVENDMFSGIGHREILDNIEMELFKLREILSSNFRSYENLNKPLIGAFDEIETAYKEKPLACGIPSGFPDLDKTIGGFKPSDYAVVFGNSGLTSLALSMATNASINQGVPTAFISMGMSDVALAKGIVAMESNTNLRKFLSGHLKPDDFRRIVKSVGRINEAPFYVVDDPNMGVFDIRAQIKQLRAKERVEIIFINNLNLIGTEDTTLQISEKLCETSKIIKGLTLELGIPIVATCWLAPDTNTDDPELFNTGVLGDIKQGADTVVVFTQKAGAKAKLRLEKTQCGKTGEMGLTHSPSFWHPTKPEFVHLHVHSDFSLCNSTATVMDLADRAEQLGMKHLAITDSGNMFGVMDFINACQRRENPINPIIGCEMYVTTGSRFEKEEPENGNHRLVLLAENREGYLNLCKLCSLAHIEGFHRHPRVDDELLGQYHKGLIALSGCACGEIPRLILEGKTEEAEQKTLHYRNIFGENNFYLEIQDQVIPAEILKSHLSQQELNKTIADISKRTSIPLVVTNNVHYLEMKDATAHDVLLCIGEGKQRDDAERKRLYGNQFYLKSGDEMIALFAEYPEAIANTVRIAERCVVDLPMVEPFHHLPEFEIPQGFSDASDYLRNIATRGLEKRYPKEKENGGDKWKEIHERLEHELDIIKAKGASNYFLIVMDYVNWARDHDIPIGSGFASTSGSIVAYSLQITNVDPIKYGLIFERFLNPELITFPNIAINFGNTGCNKVVNYIAEKYGKDRVGRIVYFKTFGAKRVFKKAARTMGFSAKKIAKFIPNRYGITLEQAFSEVPILRKMEKNPRYAELFSTARKLEGLNRRCRLHDSGVVVGKTDLLHIVPVFKEPITGAIASQYNMLHLEKIGLPNMYFMGLTALDVIRVCEDLIRNRGWEYTNFHIENIPEDDGKTFALFAQGDTVGVFQFDSCGNRDVLKRTRPQTMSDLVALNALYRPEAMDNISRFMESKNGLRAIEYPDSSLEDILNETYGVIVYQEQVMQIIRRVAGYSLGEADILRREMGKRRLHIIESEKTKFIESAARQGYSRKRANRIFDILISFAGYAFTKAHAVACVKVAYQMAYLKANFPSEFMAAEKL